MGYGNFNSIAFSNGLQEMKFKLVSDKNRRIQLNMEHIQLYVQRYKPFTPFDLSITRRVRQKVDPSRKYYFGVVLPALMEAVGYDPEDKLRLHDHLKILFFHVEPDKRGFYPANSIPSVFSEVPTVDNDQRAKFIDWVIRKAAENGAYIPDA